MRRTALALFTVLGLSGCAAFVEAIDRIGNRLETVQEKMANVETQNAIKESLTAVGVNGAAVEMALAQIQSTLTGIDAGLDLLKILFGGGAVAGAAGGGFAALKGNGRKKNGTPA